MSDLYPCPCCGSEHSADQSSCLLCGYNLSGLQARQPEAEPKCPRCGSELPGGFQFCQICGLDLRTRHGRPPTQGLGIQIGQEREERVFGQGVDRENAWDGGGVESKNEKMFWELIAIRRDGSEGQRFPLKQGHIELGRATPGLSFPDDLFLSPKHLLFEARANGLFVSDLDTRNGFFLRVSTPSPVFPGDEFLLGHQLLRLESLKRGVNTEFDQDGVRAFGTPVEQAWAKIAQVVLGGGEGDIHVLRGKEVVLGRESGQIIFPLDDFLSRQHAKITMKLVNGSMTVMLEDLNSANGTYLKIRKRRELRTGDMFRVGDQLLKVSRLS